MAAEMDGTSKGLLGVFAIFTLGSGLASLIYGIFLLMRYIGIPYNYGVFSLFAISIVLIVVGGLLIITLLLGVIAALKEISNLRLVTIVLLFLLFVVIAVVGVWTMISYKTGQLEKSIELDIKFVNEKYAELSDSLKGKADYLNQRYNCCGSFSTHDTKTNQEGIPDSCCIMPQCSDRTQNNRAKYFETGCASIYFNTKSSVVYRVSILALASAAGVLIALVSYAILSHRARAGYAQVSRG